MTDTRPFLPGTAAIWGLRRKGIRIDPGIQQLARIIHRPGDFGLASVA